MIALSIDGTKPALPRAMRNALRLVQMPTDNDADLRDTLPPSPPTEPQPGAKASAETWQGYDESNFMHRATAAVIDGTNALLAARQTYDIEAIVQRQAVLFEEKLAPKFDGLGMRVGRTEDAVKAIEARVQELKAQLEREVTRLETEIRRVRALATGQQQ